MRGGWGLYTDFAYTNQNALNAALDAAGGVGIVFLANNPAGILKPDGSFFRASDPLSTIAAQNLVNTSLPPLGGQVQSPRLEQPYTRQANVGWSHQLDSSTTLTVDALRVDGRNVNIRLRINQLVNGRRYLADLAIQPNSNQFRVALSKGTSLYEALVIGLNRRMSHRLDVSASYTFANARSIIGSSRRRDRREPRAGRPESVWSGSGCAARRGATRGIVSRSRESSKHHSASTWRRSSSISRHSPRTTFEGLDLNADGNINDKTATAYRYTGLNANGTADVQGRSARARRSTAAGAHRSPS